MFLSPNGVRMLSQQFIHESWLPRLPESKRVHLPGHASNYENANCLSPILRGNAFNASSLLDACLPCTSAWNKDWLHGHLRNILRFMVSLCRPSSVISDLRACKLCRPNSGRQAGLIPASLRSGILLFAVTCCPVGTSRSGQQLSAKGKQQHLEKRPTPGLAALSSPFGTSQIGQPSCMSQNFPVRTSLG